jgi:AAA domain
MRIAIAGTHRNGKTTLAEAAGHALRGFAVEPEPYEQLLEAGEDFVDDRAPEAFVRQLEHLVARLSLTQPGDDVIYDRSPFDFLAYLLASDEHQLGRRSASLESGVLHLAARGIASLDLVAFLPLRPGPTMRPRRSLRRLADGHLCDMLRKDSLGLLGHGQAPALIELAGSTSRRLQGLLAAIGSRSCDGSPI